jgi:predicted O-methyltransferase YrrM
MSQAFDTVLADYNERAEREDGFMRQWSPADMLTERDKFLLHVGEEVGHFLSALAVARGARRIVELGTSYGYSTLFLADAARRTGGKVFTIELAAEKQAYAREQIARAGLADHVEWLQGDALELLAGLEGPYDLVLLDLWKELYIPCLELCTPKMAEGGIIAADNILFPEIVRADAEAYRQAVRTVPGAESALLPIGQGIELSSFWRQKASCRKAG